MQIIVQNKSTCVCIKEHEGNLKPQVFLTPLFVGPNVAELYVSIEMNYVRFVIIYDSCIISASKQQPRTPEESVLSLLSYYYILIAIITNSYYYILTAIITNSYYYILTAIITNSYYDILTAIMTNSYYYILTAIITSSYYYILTAIITNSYYYILSFTS